MNIFYISNIEKMTYNYIAIHRYIDRNMSIHIYYVVVVVVVDRPTINHRYL